VHEERARHAVRRDEHDWEDDAAPAAGGKGAQRHGIDEIGHAEEIPRDRSAACIGLAAIPRIGNERREQSGRDVADAGRQREKTGQLAREIADQATRLPGYGRSGCQ